jgi:hypothetical protein
MSGKLGKDLQIHPEDKLPYTRRKKHSVRAKTCRQIIHSWQAVYTLSPRRTHIKIRNPANPANPVHAELSRVISILLPCHVST